VGISVSYDQLSELEAVLKLSKASRTLFAVRDTVKVPLFTFVVGVNTTVYVVPLPVTLEIAPPLTVKLEFVRPVIGSFAVN
jgi:hypothetical protein